jgi:hypothetical protein
VALGAAAFFAGAGLGELFFGAAFFEVVAFLATCFFGDVFCVVFF